MSDKLDYYKVLGVAKTVSKDELKKVYRKLARKFHPDVSKEKDAEAKFKEINEAYEVLSDEQKRTAYDRFGHAGLGGNLGGFSGFGGGGFRDPFDIFEEVFGSGGIFSGFGGSRGRQSGNAPRRGADLRYDMRLEFEEAVFGVEKEINVPRHETCESCKGNGVEPGTSAIRCPECKGTGEIRRQAGFFINIGTCSRCKGRGEIITSPCQECNGNGMVSKSHRLSIKIPAGVNDGTQIRLSGEGEGGLNGGPPGNLFVVTKVKQHKYFNRVESTIHLELGINITQAALGDEVEVPTIDGDDTITIPAGTQTGDTVRLRNKGVPRLRRDGTSSSRGDQIITIQVRTPINLTNAQRDMLLELGKTLDREVVPQREKGFFDRLRDVFGV